MAVRFAAWCLAPAILGFVVLSAVSAARAEDASQPPASSPAAAAPSAQKSGASGGRGNPANPPAVNSQTTAEQHRLPPDSTTKQTVVLPGRTLAFTATAGTIHLFNERGDPQADIAYTAYQLDGAEAHSRPVTFF